MDASLYADFAKEQPFAVTQTLLVVYLETRKIMGKMARRILSQ